MPRGRADFVPRLNLFRQDRNSYRPILSFSIGFMISLSRHLPQSLTHNEQIVWNVSEQVVVEVQARQLYHIVERLWFQTGDGVILKSQRAERC